jgi:hypothetical protein
MKETGFRIRNFFDISALLYSIVAAACSSMSC